MKHRLCACLKRIICVIVLLYIPIFSQTAYSQEQKVVRSQPKTGEGVYDLLLRNGRGLEYFNEFVALNKKRLGKDNSLKMGFYYIIPPKKTGKSTATTKTDATVTSKKKPAADNVKTPEVKPASTIIGKTITEPLFGPSKQTFKIESEQLKDACFYIVSGHGDRKSVV